MDAKELLVKTKDWLTEETWARGTYWMKPDGSSTVLREHTKKTCLLGALAYVAGAEGFSGELRWFDQFPEMRYASHLLYEAIDHYVMEEQMWEGCVPLSVTEFNDHDHTQLDDVHRVIDLAIDAYTELTEGGD